MRDINPLAIRMPTTLKEQLETAATDNRRSLNAELVVRLEHSFQPLQRFSTGDLVAELVARHKIDGIDVRVTD